jgi:tetratricopeptide (TPR) repeat protein
VQENQKALALEPFTPVVRYNLASSLMFARRFAESEKEFRKILDMDPNFHLAHFGLANVLGCQHNLEEALAEAEKTVNAIPESSFYRGFLGYSLAKAGRTEEARKILRDLTEEAKTKYVSWLGIAYIYQGLGEKDHTFAALELAYQQGDSRMVTVRARADLDSFWKNDPRFGELLKKVGLPPLN